jgi:hypothetical protein
MEENLDNLENVDGIKKTVEYIIGTDTKITRKKKTEKDLEMERFEQMVIALERVHTRSTLMGGEFDLDFVKYDEAFYMAIDSLIVQAFGNELSELLFFYIYERLNPDGSINVLVDEEGNKIILQNPSDLYLLMQVMKEKLGSKAKKK